MMLLNAGVDGRIALRMWYFGETKAQAEEAISAVDQERMQAMTMTAMMPTSPMTTD